MKLERPTDAYLADLLNEAADTLDCYARVPRSPTIVAMHQKLKNASKALRENPLPQGYLSAEAKARFEKGFSPQEWSKLEDRVERLEDASLAKEPG